MTDQQKPRRRVKHPGLIALGVLVALIMFGAAHCSHGTRTAGDTLASVGRHE